MDLEFNIEDLFKKRNIESDRIEFKKGWNPDDIYHSVCAYANDYDNLGGGYIVVGVEERNGIAVRPVLGIPEKDLDRIQKEMIGYNNLMAPPYFPGVVTEKVDGKWILVLVCRTGQPRPYKVPEYISSKKDKKYYYYIRYATSSVKANTEQERELVSMADQTPFDARPNQSASFDDISPLLLEDHLRKTGSKLASQVKERGVESILEDMQLLVGPPEHRYIQNVALMMFCEYQEKFFMYTHVQMTVFPEGSINNPSLSEDFPIIKGSVPQMIEATLERFKTLILREKVIKVKGQAEAIRIWNYPYQAIEEAVVNAFYHRDYLSYEPVTIEIEPDCINIINFPGIDRSISDKSIEEGKRFVSRYYRNRRLGDFLKELNLSEGHSTGVPTIQEELEKNGSPKAIFHTDEDRRAMRIQIPIHPAFLNDKKEVEVVKNDNGGKSGGNLKRLSESTGKNEMLSNSLNNVFNINDVENDVKSDVEKAKMILAEIRKNNKISQKSLSEKTGIPYATLQRLMNKLKKDGVIRRVGSAKGGYWEIM